MTIKLVGFDIDGTLTDGGFFFMGGDKWSQRFSVRDGVGIKMLQSAGIEVAFVTNSKFESAIARAKMLDVKEAHFGISDKIQCWESIMQRLGVSYDHTAFMGDEDMDLPVLERVEFSGTVFEAEKRVQEKCKFVATKPAGNGAAREFVEAIFSRYSL